MASSYPTSIDNFTNLSGTQTLAAANHSVAHNNLNSAVNLIETTLGTTSGTAVIKNITVGKFAVSNDGGTLNNAIVGTPRITGGTASEFILGTSTIQGGTVVGAAITTSSINSSTIGTPVINVGSDATGDLYYRNGGTYARLPIGTANHVLTSNGTVPSWAAANALTDSGIVAGTTNIAVSSSAETDISGATLSITPSVASYMIVQGVFDIEATTTGDVILGYLDVDGANETAAATFKSAGTNDRKSVAQTWRLSLTAAAHTIKMQGTRNSGSGTATFNAVHTRFSYMVFNQ